MRPRRLLVVLALAVALSSAFGVWRSAFGPLHVQHPAAAFRHAACLCPLCVVTEGLVEVSWSEYC